MVIIIILYYCQQFSFVANIYFSSVPKTLSIPIPKPCPKTNHKKKNNLGTYILPVYKRFSLSLFLSFFFPLPSSSIPGFFCFFVYPLIFFHFIVFILTCLVTSIVHQPRIHFIISDVCSNLDWRVLRSPALLYLGSKAFP